MNVAQEVAVGAVSLGCLLLGLLVEDAALSLASTSCESSFISLSSFQSSSLGAFRLIINLNSWGNLFINTEVSRLPYEAEGIPSNFKLWRFDSTMS